MLSLYELVCVCPWLVKKLERLVGANTVGHLSRELMTMKMYFKTLHKICYVTLNLDCRLNQLFFIEVHFLNSFFCKILGNNIFQIVSKKLKRKKNEILWPKDIKLRLIKFTFGRSKLECLSDSERYNLFQRLKARLEAYPLSGAPKKYSTRETLNFSLSLLS